MPQNNPTNPAPDYGKVLLSWKAPEYEQQEKSRGWFITAGIIGALLIGSAIFMRNYLLIIVVVLFGIVIYILHKKGPLLLDIKITEKGIKSGDKFYPYKDLDAFWIIYDPPVKTLNLKVNKTFFAELSLQIADQDPLKIRETLLTYLPEDEEKTEESDGEKLNRVLKI